MTLVRQKALLFVLLGALVTIIYFATLHSTRFAAVIVPATWLDGAIPFVPAAVVAYASFFVFLLLPLFVIADEAELGDVAFGFGLIVVLSGVAFFFWPTAIAFTDTHPLLNGLVALDGERNACPSLHASLALYCTLCARRRLRTRIARFSLLFWTILIMASPLLIKRHAAIDIAAGAMLGWAVYVALLRPSRDEGPDTECVLETVRIRKALAREVSLEFDGLTAHDMRKRGGELAFFIGMAALGFAISIRGNSSGSAPLLAAGILVTAVALNTFPLLVHEGMHGVLFQNRRWNGIVSVALGSAFLMSFSAYRVLHLRHHRYLGDPRDPDDYHNYSRRLPVVWSLHFVRLTVGPLLYLLLIPVLALKHGSRAQRRRICAEYTLMFAMYSVLLRLFAARDLFLVWFVPLLLMGTLTAIRGFTQHGITRAADPYLASRTMLPNPIVAFFLLNENYHLEHHLFPEVPSYRLPALHALIWPRLPRAVAGRSYLRFLIAFLQAAPRMDETPIGVVRPGEHTS